MSQSFQTRPNGRQVAAAAWRGFFGALFGMPLLFIASAAAFVALALGMKYLGAKLELTDTFLDGMSGDDAWFYVIKPLATVLLAIPVAMAVSRMVLLDEVGANLFSAAGKRFSLWAVTLALFCLLLFYVKGLMFNPALQVMAALFWIFIVALPVGVAPIFPALAVSTNSWGASARLEAGLHQWQGNFWLFVRSAFLTLGVVWLIWWVPHRAIAARGGQPFLDRIEASQTWMIVTAALTPLLIALAAAQLASFHAWARQNQPKS